MFRKNHPPKRRLSPFRYIVKMVVVFSVIGVIILAVSLAGAQIIISQHHKYATKNPETITNKLTQSPATAIVFGSGVDPAGQPRPVLKKRLDAAGELFHHGAVERIIVSGYDLPDGYSEPAAMSRYLTSQHNVPHANIQQDPGGNNTHATCSHAHDNFSVNEAVLVTQSGHLDRAIYLCRARGITSYGFAADPVESHEQTWSYVQSAREGFSNIKAILNVQFPSIEAFH